MIHICIGSDEKLYTYTIITTSSNAYLTFLHDRMPAILEPGSEEMKAWLDPSRTTWSKELQSALKPYEGELECYAVPREVGKVGNNSPDFVIPVKENKNNIANFFANAKKSSDKARAPARNVVNVKSEEEEHKPQHARAPTDSSKATQDSTTSKREHTPDNDDETAGDETKRPKLEASSSTPSPNKSSGPKTPPSAKIKSAKNKDNCSQKITSFFKK